MHTVISDSMTDDMTNLLDDRWWRRLALCGLAALGAAAAAWPLDAQLVRVFNPDGPGWWNPVLSALHHVGYVQCTE